MEKNRVRDRWQTAGAVFTLAVETLLHFVYQWTGENKIAGIISPVSESTWEHLKMLFFPAFLFGVVEYTAYGRKLKNFISVRILSIFLGMAVIVTVFYTYTGILGTNYLWADIATFFAGVAAVYLFSRHYLRTYLFSSPFTRGAAILAFLAFLLCFILFTFRPPQIALFLNPGTIP